MAWDEDTIRMFESMNDETWDSLDDSWKNAYFNWQDEELAKNIFLIVKVLFFLGLVILIWILLK